MKTASFNQVSTKQSSEIAWTARGERVKRVSKLVAGVALGALITLVGAKAHDSYVDKTTIDPNSVTAVADTVPNPTLGGKDMLRTMLQSNNPAEVAAASHVDASDLGREISEAVYDATGENALEITANHKVEVTIEPDGDIASAQVIDNPSNQ